MLGCRDKVVDLFVTKDSKEYAKEFDDEFVGPVWSVDIEADGKAVIVNKTSQWVTWCMAGVKDTLEEGDLVRIGHVGTGAHTNYATIVQKLPITELKNRVTHNTDTASIETNDLQVYKGTTFYDGSGLSVDPINTLMASDGAGADGRENTTYTKKILKPATGLDYTSAGRLSDVSDVGVTLSGIQADTTWYAYRLNAPFNLTRPTPDWTVSHLAPGKVQDNALFTKRHLFRHSEKTGVSSWNEQLFYPLYKVRRWLTNNGEFSVKLDHSVKSLHWIKLMGYSVMNKREAGYQSNHEVTQDDWIALDIKEIKGAVISNNASAHGSFAVLHTGSTNNDATGAVHYDRFDPQGLHTHIFEGHNCAIRDLNMRFSDRKGQAAHFGRIHLWFKVCVQHG